MRNKGIMLAAALMTVVGLATTASAELSEKYRGWADGPAGYLLTKPEKKAWDAIATDAAAKDFIALFWARRDPDPTDSFNPFKAEFDARVRYADEHFSHDETAGSMTDRGRVLLLLGPPHQAEKRSPTETVELMDNTSAGTDEVRANAELWVYDPDRLPEQLKVKGSRLLYVFYEQKAETNNFVLDRSHREATMGLRLLSRATEVALVNPDLEEVPKPVPFPGAEAAGASALTQLDAASAEWNDKAMLLLDAGMADQTHRPIWLHLELPGEAPKLERIAGRVLSDGDVLSTFEVAAQAVTTNSGGAAYHLTFPVAAGSYQIDVVGLAAGSAVVTASGAIEVVDVPAEGTWLSPLWVGLQAVRDENFRLGDPFTFGGWHLVPLADRPIPHASELSYFGFVVRPSGEDADQAQLESKITLKKDGARMGAPLKQPLPVGRISDDLFMYGDAINLAGLPEPGDYTLVFEISDPAAGVTVERTVELHIVD